MRELMPTKGELMDREQLLKDLTTFIRRSYPTAVLTLYGSSCNGFAITNSDMVIKKYFVSLVSMILSNLLGSFGNSLEAYF
jgi:hypothetical protein